MNVERLESDVYLVSGKTYDSNATIFLADGEALMIDAMGSRRDAHELKGFVEGQLGARVAFQVSTHYFSDHMAALALFAGSVILAHRHYRHTFDGELHRSEEERGFFVRPTMLIGDGVVIRWGRFTVDVFHNPGHTLSTLCVDVPEADLLHVSDTAVGRIAYFLYTSPELLSGALERLQRRSRRRIVRSHGPVAAPETLDSAQHYLRELERVVRAVRGAGGGEGVLRIPLKECLPKGMEPSAFEEFFHARNLQDVVARSLFDGN